jgi:hypothetical protein
MLNAYQDPERTYHNIRPGQAFEVVAHFRAYLFDLGALVDAFESAICHTLAQAEDDATVLTCDQQNPTPHSENSV